MNPLFNRASSWIKGRFGQRVQKIPIDAGFSCPNRDGKLSDQGCLYCSNPSFSPFYSDSQLSISEQLCRGRDYFARRYGCNSFFAYFQSYSCTYAPLDVLRRKYLEAINCEGIVGLVIATRPDCVDISIIALLQQLSEKACIRIELGVESFDDGVLAAINRCHDSAAALQAIARLRAAGIPVSTHLISGLPGERHDHMIRAAQIVSDSGAEMVKLHHLQIVKGSRLAALYAENPGDYPLYTLEEYIERVCEFITHLSPAIYLERFLNRVPPDQLVAPIFSGIDEAGFQRRLEQRLHELGLYQGARVVAR